MSATVNQWIVQRFVGNLADGPRWEDVEPLDVRNGSPGTWEAPNAGEAFRSAVLANRDARIEDTSYRVLPWDGGATFNVGIEVTGRGHGQTTEQPVEPAEAHV